MADENSLNNSVTFTHPEYDELIPQWLATRDVLAGPARIEDGGTDYLPAPPGASGSAVTFTPEGKRLNPEGDRYEFYLSMAEFPDITAIAVDGMQGLIHGEPPEVTLPDSMNYLHDQATPDRMSLADLWEYVTREVISSGRIGLLAEIGDNDRVYLCPYNAETIRNWRLDPRRAGGLPRLIVLLEASEEAEGAFGSELRKVYRVLRRIQVDGQMRYVVALYSEDDNGEFVPQVPDEFLDDEGQVIDGIVEDPETGEIMFTPQFIGAIAAEEIPFTVINAMNTRFSVGRIPIYCMVQRALSIYRKSADYNRSLYIKSDPQIVLAGVPKGQEPENIGGNSLWSFTSKDTRWGMLDIDGQGIPLQRQSINDQYDRFMEEGGRMLDTRDRGAESGEALRRRSQGHTITLSSIVTNAAAGMRLALQSIARITNADPDSIVFNANLDFLESNMTGQELLQLMMARNEGAPISLQSIHRLAQRRGLTIEEYVDELNQYQGESRAQAFRQGDDNAGSEDTRSAGIVGGNLGQDTPAENSDDTAN